VFCCRSQNHNSLFLFFPFHPRIAHKEKQIEKLIAEAKAKMKAKNEKGAKICMRRKRGLETDVDNMNNQINLLDEQNRALEKVTFDMGTMKTIKSVQAQQQKVNNKISQDEVHEIMDDVRVGIQEANGISEAMAMGATDEYEDDEEDLLAELREDEEVDLEEKVLSRPNVNPATTTAPAAALDLPTVPLDLPSQPRNVPKTKEQLQDEQDAADLQGLMAEMAM